MIPVSGRLIVTGQVVVDIVLAVSAIPMSGDDVFAADHMLSAGGDFNVMAAAARDGASVVYTGGHGVGQFSDLARAAMKAEGITFVAAPALNDTGFSVAMIEPSAERTFVSVRGAECVARLDDLRAASVSPSDVVLISGYSLLDVDKSRVLLAGLADLPEQTIVAFDPGPLLAEIPGPILEKVLRRTDIWTSNEREARDYCQSDSASTSECVGRISGDLRVGGLRSRDLRSGDLGAGGLVVIRTGSRGCTVGRTDGSGQVVSQGVSGFSVAAIDTNGAGDAHTGVFLASLLCGLETLDPLKAARRANAAAALAVTRLGPATAPTAGEIEEFLAAHPG